MAIKLYECKFKMSFHDDFHVVIRPFNENISDKRAFMAEELCIPKLWIKYVKEVNNQSTLLIDKPTYGNYSVHIVHKKEEG